MSGDDNESSYVDQSDNPDNQDDPGIRLLGRLVRYKDVVAFCEETLPDATCTACKKGAYAIALYSPHKDRITVVTSVSIVTSPEGKAGFALNTDLFMPVFYLFCDTCGHLRHHLVAKVVQWLEQRDEIAELEGRSDE